MNYFITLNTKSNMSYEYLIKEIEKTFIDILGIEAVTERLIYGTDDSYS